MNSDIRFLKGIGEARALRFSRLGIHTIEDLLYFFPRGYEDRSNRRNIEDCIDGESVCISATVSSSVKEIRTKGKIRIYTMSISDETAVMQVTWYNNKYVKNVFSPGDKYIFYGKISKRGKNIELLNPIYEKQGLEKYTGKVVPIYPLTSGLAQKNIQSVMQLALEKVLPVNEYLNDTIRTRYKIADINYSIQNIHFPKTFEDYEKSRIRFVFEEFLIIQLALLQKRGEYEKSTSIKFENSKIIRQFTDRLPFELTSAQKRTINEICIDLKSGYQMNRLIQGDVGSGKTAVAAAAMYLAVKNGVQCVMMAPTEILSAQHFETLNKMFDGTGINIVKLSGGMTAKEKSFTYDLIENGLADIIVGTHAVIEKKVIYKNLGLVIADEQHRFGVEQRAKLASKGNNPHMLIMSATPIPRTLALILYGDLKISIIDELPPGRKPVKTFSADESMRERVYAFLDKSIKEGNQAYIVCPLIEETENDDLKNAKDLSVRLQEIFPKYNVGLIHSKLKSKEKEDVMTRFAEGKIKILVSTTVIEVGVNVPKANIMIIENAERFGLSQLHQLRGRVGRGCDEAYCIMFSHAKNEITKKRIKTMCESNDGFYISEQDLELRGPGDFFGVRQHGLPEMRIANLSHDRDILIKAQDCTRFILQYDSKLEREENQGLKKKINKLIQESVIMN